MWSKLAEILQDPSYKRFGIALLISAVLHALLFGGFDFSLPNLKKELHLIEARIQMPKAVVKQVEAPGSEEILAPKPAPELPKATPPEANVEAPPEPFSETTIENPTPVITEVPPTPEPPPENSEPAEQEPQPVDAGLVINENAYQYVETYFDVSAAIDGSAEGKAKIIFNLVENKQYELNWLTEGSGLIALLFPDLLQTSEGILTKTGLQPTSYLYQFGNKADKTRIVNFDWQNKKLMQQTSKGTKTEDLPEGTQDLLSFMYQFMYVAPLQHMQIPIATGKKLRVYDYSFEGEEITNGAMGELKTLHILHSGEDSDEKTELWLAIDYQYVPVKIRKIEKNGKVVEMLATRIVTNRPTVNDLQVIEKNKQ